MRFPLFVFVLSCLLLVGACSTSSPVHRPSPPVSEATEATGQWLERHRDRPPLLRDFLEQMPKGGDLHTHLTGAVYAETYLEWAVEQDLCARLDPGRLVSCSSLPGSAAAGSAAAPPLTADSVQSTPSLYNEMVDALSLRNLDVRSVTGREQFFATFGRFGAVYRDRPLRAGDAIAELVRRAARQNVHHVEMIVFDAPFTQTGGREVDSLAATVRNTDDWSVLQSQLQAAGMDETVAAGRQFLDRAEARADSLLGCGTHTAEPGCEVTRRYRMHALRVLAPRVVFARLLYGMKRAATDPRVKAIDMVAPEDNRIALRDYDRHLRMLQFLRGSVNQEQDSVHVGLHAGELALGLVPPQHLDDHVRQAVEVAGADRVGHAVDVGFETNTTGLLETMRDRGVAVEVCLTSNEVILGVRGDSHPLPDFLDAGVPVVLATDDEGVARIDLTHEYQRAATRYGLDYRTLKTISRNSLYHSFLDGNSLWASSDYETYAAPCTAADPASPGVPSRCQSFLDANPKAAAEWRLERDFVRFERSFLSR